MQNWYSQNNPLRSNGVEVGITVGRAAGVLVEIEASVVATASSMGRLVPGVAVNPGNEQELDIATSKRIIKNCLMRRLYNFSEHFILRDVLRVKE